MTAASIVVTALYPKGCEATHCRRFFSAIAWDFADHIAYVDSARRHHVHHHRAEIAGDVTR